MMDYKIPETRGSGMLVLLRHGESSLNAEGRFSGWSDCPLTPEGIRQAHASGRILRDAGIGFDVCFTSVLSRAVETAAIVLGELDLSDVPVTKTWQLNERHYGILEGTSKRDAVEQYGAGQVEAWRNTPDATPPPLAHNDMRHPRHKEDYGDVATDMLPASECLRDAFRRVIAFFESEIRPLVEGGRNVLVVTHGNPVRAIVSDLNGLQDGEIPMIEVRNAIPIAYMPDHSGKLVNVSIVGNWHGDERQS